MIEGHNMKCSRFELFWLLQDALRCFLLWCKKWNIFEVCTKWVSGELQLMKLNGANVYNVDPGDYFAHCIEENGSVIEGQRRANLPKTTLTGWLGFDNISRIRIGYQDAV